MFYKIRGPRETSRFKVGVVTTGSRDLTPEGQRIFYGNDPERQVMGKEMTKHSPGNKKTSVNWKTV